MNLETFTLHFINCFALASCNEYCIVCKIASDIFVLK